MNRTPFTTLADRTANQAGRLSAAQQHIVAAEYRRVSKLAAVVTGISGLLLAFVLTNLATGQTSENERLLTLVILIFPLLLSLPTIRRAFALRRDVRSGQVRRDQGNLTFLEATTERPPRTVVVDTQRTYMWYGGLLRDYPTTGTVYYTPAARMAVGVEPTFPTTDDPAPAE